MPSLAEIARTQFNLSLTDVQLRAFAQYAAALTDWNARTNLTAITDPQAIDVWHFADSLSVLTVMSGRRAGARVIDVGTGAGFPGLPLKVACPEIDLTLVEATGKKVEFLRHVVQLLGLKSVALIHGRAEEVGQDAAHRERYDWVLARAVAAMPALAEYLLPLCKLGGNCIAQKGESAMQEAAEAERAIAILGGKLSALQAVELPGVAATRYLVTIHKVAATPPKYPRRPGMPSKRPIR